MTTYTAILNSEIDPDSPITTGLMTKIRDNPIAITEKASGAPVLANSYVVEAMINASAVSQGKLKTTTGEVSTASSSFVSVTLPGGQYGFFPYTRISSTGAGGDITILDAGVSVSSTAVTRVCMRHSSVTVYAGQRYIQSSPPYDIGDGEINSFIFALINNTTGKIKATYIAQDPPWANNGKTRVNPDYHTEKNGKIVGMQVARNRSVTMEDVKASRATIEEFATVSEGDIEVTQAIKNADMVDIPHPFMENDLTGLSVVLIDPYSQLALDIKYMQEDGVTVTDIITDYINIDNKHIEGLITPEGVKIVKASWKNTIDAVEGSTGIFNKLKAIITK